jgi:hypothetical protein
MVLLGMEKARDLGLTTAEYDVLVGTGFEPCMVTKYINDFGAEVTKATIKTRRKL